MAIGSLSGPARVDGAWLWGVHLHVQVRAQRDRRVEPHPAQRRAGAGLCLCGPATMSSGALSGYRCRSGSRAPPFLARALDVERVAWPRGKARCPPGLRPARATEDRSCATGLHPTSTTSLERGGSSERPSVSFYKKYISKVFDNNNRVGAGRRARAAACSFGSRSGPRPASGVAPPITKCQVVCRLWAGSPRRTLCSTSP